MEKEKENITEKDVNTYDVINNYIKMSVKYSIDGDESNALKYASLATIITFTPRPDACCCLGDRYFERGNLQWAKKWYESALYDYTDINSCDVMCYTWYPLAKISEIHMLSGEYDKSDKYLSACELLSPNNEKLQKIRLALEEFKKNISF